MNISQFDFELPPELVAQEPASERADSRLLCLSRESGAITHAVIAALPSLLHPGDLLVVNNTRVFPARLLGTRVPSGGVVECLLLSPQRSDGRQTGGRHLSDAGEQFWEALVHPGQKLKPGAQMVFEGARPLQGEILERRFFGRRLVRLWTKDGSPVDAAVDAIGHIPLPPYIKRDDRASDRERYQTMFARTRGSVAAPTAGLHFTPQLAAAIVDAGARIVEITLHVGYGTFQPIRVEDVADHRMEVERYAIDQAAATAINAALDERRRVIAVGTTTTRTLEASARADGRVHAGAGETDLFIFPGFQFRVIGGLLTNFHLPQSSLLMLVSAFAGRERALAAYADAIERRYRFYSYGDAMLIT